MVFQDYTSFDNRTVEDNVAFGLECRGVPATRAPRAGARVDRARSASTSSATPRKYPQRAVGRHAPARRDRAHADPVAAHHPDGRAVRRARSDDAAAHAGRCWSICGAKRRRRCSSSRTRSKKRSTSAIASTSSRRRRARSCARWRCRRRIVRRKEMQREPAFVERVFEIRDIIDKLEASTRAGDD